jgi:phage repressor protein C with HTH and peptisase S24 domain
MEASRRYDEKAYDRINLKVKKGKRDEYRQYADAQNDSLNNYIIEAVEERIQHEGKASPKVRTNDNDRSVPQYDLPAAAGAGEFLDSDNFILVNVDNSVPLSAHFGVRIKGDSMMPEYPDGHIAWVRRSVDIDPGNVGVFMLNGAGYIKKMGRGELLSLNPAYEPIRWGMDDTIRVSGIVVGVTEDVYS